MHDHKGTQLIQIAPLEQPKIQHTQKPHDHSTQFLVGLDVGSTTVKAVVVEAATDQTAGEDARIPETHGSRGWD
jgi:activator of 2-hydroxyglutaryl-CoA dehydratase